MNGRKIDPGIGNRIKAKEEKRLGGYKRPQGGWGGKNGFRHLFTLKQILYREGRADGGEKNWGKVGERFE